MLSVMSVFGYFKDVKTLELVWWLCHLKKKKKLSCYLRFRFTKCALYTPVQYLFLTCFYAGEFSQTFRSEDNNMFYIFSVNVKISNKNNHSFTITTIRELSVRYGIYQ